jgi:hypothetical protein
MFENKGLGQFFISTFRSEPQIGHLVPGTRTVPMHRAQDTAVGCGYIVLREIQSTGCLAGPADDEFRCLQSDSQPSFAVPSLLDCARSTRYQVLVL